MNKVQQVRICKEFRFEMAHALLNYDGPCRNIHGHSYKLRVVLAGALITDTANPKNGMVMDFTDIKKIVHHAVIDKFDHSLVLNEASAASGLQELNKHYEKVLLMPFQPTCENLLLHYVRLMKDALPEHMQLHSLRLSESANSFSEWCEADSG